MINIPKNIKELKTYKPGKSHKELKNDFGLERIIDLGSNENPLGASPKAIVKMTKSFKNIQLYPDGSCHELRSTIADKFNKKVNNVIVGNGSEGIINYIFKAFFRGNEEILTFKGSFIGVYIAAKSADMKCIQLDLTGNYGFDLNHILKNINPNTKAIYLANPNNPTGTIFNKIEFEYLMSKVPKNIIVILDEAYCEYAIDLTEDYPIGLDYEFDNLITLRSFSKAYGLAGMRIGFGFASENIIESLMKVKLTFEPSSVAQAAGIGAINDDDFLNKVIENNRVGLNYYYQELDKIGIKYIKSFGNFLMIVLDSEELVNKLNELLISKGIIIRPLKVFGLPNCARIAVGTPEDNKSCIEAINLFVSNHKN